MNKRSFHLCFLLNLKIIAHSCYKYNQTQCFQVLQVEYYTVRYLNDIIKMMSIIYNVHYNHQSHEKYTQ